MLVETWIDRSCVIGGYFVSKIFNFLWLDIFINSSKLISNPLVNLASLKLFLTSLSISPITPKISSFPSLKVLINADWYGLNVGNIYLIQTGKSIWELWVINVYSIFEILKLLNTFSKYLVIGYNK